MTKSSSPRTIRTATPIFRMQSKNFWNSMASRRKAKKKFSGTTAHDCTGWADDQRIFGICDFRLRKRKDESKIFEATSELFFRQSKISNPKSKMGRTPGRRRRVRVVWSCG